MYRGMREGRVYLDEIVPFYYGTVNMTYIGMRITGQPRAQGGRRSEPSRMDGGRAT